MTRFASLRWIAFASMALLLAGCPDPGLTTNPLNTPEDGLPVVSVCYPPLVTDDGEVTPLAMNGCTEAGIDGPELRYWKKNLVFNDCPLLKKARRSWFCEAGQGSAGPSGPQHELYLPPAPMPDDDAESSSPPAPEAPL